MEYVNPKPDWIDQQCDSITINDDQIQFRCNYATITKSRDNDMPSIQLDLFVYSNNNQAWLHHKDFKGSYLAEKVASYIKNTVNGQRAVYWENRNPVCFNQGVNPDDQLTQREFDRMMKFLYSPETHNQFTQLAEKHNLELKDKIING